LLSYRLVAFLLNTHFQGSSTSPIPPTYLEQKRKEAQIQYKEEIAYIQEHKADFERLMEEERQAAEKEMSGTLLGALDALTNGSKKEKKGSAEQGSVATDSSRGDSSIDHSSPPSTLGKT
jgi:mitochondrial import inner membrane translocase subunit TIM50